jgi:V-type H+-transporting ATPase subunit E
VDLLLDDRYSLTEKKEKSTESVKKSDESNICFGGVVMTNADGLIVCKNTLDTRLELAYQHLLPSIRRRLYE